MKMDGQHGQPIICTECGEELEEFCFSPLVKNMKAIKKRMETCRKNGRLNGECCARLLIAEDAPPSIFGPPEDE